MVVILTQPDNDISTSVVAATYTYLAKSSLQTDIMNVITNLLIIGGAGGGGGGGMGRGEGFVFSYSLSVT